MHQRSIDLSENKRTKMRSEEASSSSFSFDFLLLCLFTISTFFSPKYYLGDSFARVPIILATATAVFYLLSRLRKTKSILQLAPPIYFLLVFLGFAAYSTYIASVDLERSNLMFGYLYKNIIVCLLISQIVDTPKKLQRFVLVLSVCAIGNAYQLSYFPVWDRGRAWLEGTAFGGDPNIVSLMFIYTLPLVFGLMVLSKKWFLRILYFGGIYLLFLGLFEAQSRGAFVALVVMTCFGILIIKPRKYQIIFAIFIISLEGFMFYRYAPYAYTARMYEIAAPSTDETGSAQARMTAMQVALDYTIKNPISEYGVGNHSYHLVNIYYGEDYDQEEDIFRGGYLAHNIFLQIGADMGWIPLVVFVLFVLSLFFNLRSSYKIFSVVEGKEGASCLVLVLAFSASLCGLLTGSFFLAGAYQNYLFLIAGCCLALSFIARHPRYHTGNEGPGHRP